MRRQRHGRVLILLLHFVLTGIAASPPRSAIGAEPAEASAAEKDKAAAMEAAAKDAAAKDAAARDAAAKDAAAKDAAAKESSAKEEAAAQLAPVLEKSPEVPEAMAPSITTTIDPAALRASMARAVDWDFEDGLEGWTATGDAFDTQPTRGDNVVAARVRADMTLEGGGIGGDYWRRIPHPIGHHGGGWVGTHEDHADASAPLGGLRGDKPTGHLTSADFPLDADHRFIAFQIGGGDGIETERVELQVNGADEADVALLQRLVATRRDGLVALGQALFGGVVQGGGGVIGSLDGSRVVALAATGQRSEIMRQVVFDVPESLRGRRGRIRIVDDSSGDWGHVNVDDFRFGATRPPERPPRAWGFADIHTHPSYDLAFGGNFIQGSLTARDGSPHGAEGSAARERHRRAALPPLFSGAVDRARVGEVGPFVQLIASGEAAGAVLDATADARSGYPDLRGYPAFNQQIGQMMYGEWIRRAYDGGLRLMSALSTNSWLASAHPIKRAVLGSPRPEDDKASEDAQVADIKAWALRPENASWAEVALTPADARRIIAANKLAIVLGLD